MFLLELSLEIFNLDLKIRIWKMTLKIVYFFLNISVSKVKSKFQSENQLHVMPKSEDSNEEELKIRNWKTTLNIFFKLSIFLSVRLKPSYILKISFLSCLFPKIIMKNASKLKSGRRPSNVLIFLLLNISVN